MNFITIDFETATGKPESAISIGLVKYLNYRPVSSYYSLIRPPNLYIRQDFTELHGLTADNVRDAPDFGFIWKNEIKGFIGNAMLAAHNASFDMRVLKAVLELYKLGVPEISYFCTLNLARLAWPKFESHALAALAENFGIIYNAHNALDDALTCGKLVQLAAREFNCEKNIKEFLEYMGVGINYLGK